MLLNEQVFVKAIPNCVVCLRQLVASPSPVFLCESRLKLLTLTSMGFSARTLTGFLQGLTTYLFYKIGLTFSWKFTKIDTRIA